MALEIRLAVTQPYHDASGAVVYDVGQTFPLGEKLPDGVRTRQVIAETQDAPDAKAPAKAAKSA